MNLEQYCRNIRIKKVEEHTDILTEICTSLNNCANCCECKLENIVNILEICDIGDGSFRMPGSWDSKIYKTFLDIASRYKYLFYIINIEDGDSFVQFRKDK